MLTAACSWFWSPGFLSGVCAWSKLETKRDMARRIVLVVVLVLCGFIAALAGPASAILMIPTVVDWPVGGVMYWINGK